MLFEVIVGGHRIDDMDHIGAFALEQQVEKEQALADRNAADKSISFQRLGASEDRTARKDEVSGP